MQTKANTEGIAKLKATTNVEGHSIVGHKIVCPMLREIHEEEEKQEAKIESSGERTAYDYFDLAVVAGDSGQTETAHGAIFIDVYNSDFLANTWVEIPLPPGTETDYIELMTESGAEFYEVEILTAGSQPTPVPELNWGQIKRG